MSRPKSISLARTKRAQRKREFVVAVLVALAVAGVLTGGMYLMNRL